VSFLEIPERSAKPRERGLTHVIDRGLSMAEVDGLLAHRHFFSTPACRSCKIAAVV
jgi:hypothetical protein